MKLDLQTKLSFASILLAVTVTGRFCVAQDSSTSANRENGTELGDHTSATLKLRFAQEKNAVQFPLHDVVIAFLSTKNSSSKRPPEDLDNLARLELSNHKFNSRVNLVKPGQKIEILNSDSHDHNLNVNGFRNHPRNFIVRASDRITFKFDDAESIPISVESNVHPSVQTWFVIADHDNVSLSNEEGEITLSGLRVGKFDFRLWHPEVGYLHLESKDGRHVLKKKQKTSTINLQSGDNELATFVIR